MTVLAGDIGGTNSRLAIYDVPSTGLRGVKPIFEQTYPSAAHASLDVIAQKFLTVAAGAVGARAGVDSACFGIAGPIEHNICRATNLPWVVDGNALAQKLGIARVVLVNDFHAAALGVTAVEPDELVALGGDVRVPHGPMAVLGAGTGLGQALLHNVDGRFLPSASEAGHADFAARTEREIALVRDLTTRYGRADVEHVVSGRGLINIHRVAHEQPCAAGVDLESPDAAAAMSAAALERRCPGCVETLDMFVEAYGAESGNLALRSVSTGGLYIGGGIAPKILPALTTGPFMRTFLAKPPLDPMLAAMPVKVILNAEAGLLGAAVFAAQRR